LVELTVACIRNHQPAFPQDLSENALAVQACCAIAIGEVIGGDTAVPSRVRTLAAVLTKAATSVRPPVQERYLRAIIDTLSKSATDSLQQAAEAARRREPLSMVALDRIQPPTELGDFASFWEGARKAWRDFAAAAERQSQADREELEVLWWVYGGHSQTTGELLSKMKLGAAILCCGAEIADRVLVPPLSSTRDIVRRVVETSRKPTEQSDKALTDLVKSWEPSVLPAFAPPRGTADQALASSRPGLLPLTWLSLRLIESGATVAWEPEFTSKTKLSSDHTARPAAWAEQIYWERVARRIFVSPQV
jgi:hypothetical protein